VCPTFFQDGCVVMDIKIEEVTEVKEEELDPLSITCPTLKTGNEVSRVAAVTQLIVPLFIIYFKYFNKSCKFSNAEVKT
jgi:hypothetical protein